MDLEDKVVRLLHVSDLHMRDRDLTLIKYVVDALLQDLKSRGDESSIDLVAFTGDLAFAGKMSEYKLAQRYFIDPLLEVLGLGYNHLFLVPGNHDVNLQLRDDIHDAGVRSMIASEAILGDKLTDQQFLKRILKPQTHFHQFRRAIHKEEGRAEYLGGLIQLSSCTVNNLRVTFACFNTAWFAKGGEEDNRKLLMGSLQCIKATECIDGDSDLKVALLHHPLPWLTNWDEVEVKRVLHNTFDVVLTGHLHETEPIHLADSSGEVFMSQSGAVFDGAYKWYCGYTLITFSSKFNTFSTEFRNYSRQRREFVANTSIAPHGRGVYTMHGVPSAEVVTTEDTIYSNLLEYYSAGLLSGHLSRRAPEKFNEIFIKPPLGEDDESLGRTVQSLMHRSVKDSGGLALPIAEAIAPKNSDELGLDDLISHDCRRWFLFGEQGSGKTTLLQALALQSRERAPTVFPVYIDMKMANDLNGALREKLTYHGDALDTIQARSIVIAVDNIDLHNQLHREQVCRLLADYPEITLFAAGNYSAAGGLSSSELRLLAEFDARQVFLMPWSSREIRELVDRWFGGEGVSGQVGESDKRKVFKIISRNIEANGFAVTPLIVVCLLSALENNLSILSADRVALLRTVTQNVLSRQLLARGFSDLIDFEMVEGFFAFLAMNIKSEESVSTAQFRQLIEDFMRLRGLPGMQVLSEKHLVATGIIKSVNERLVFRQSIFLDFYLFKAFDDYPQFLEDILARGEVVEYSGALEIRACAKRADGSLLRKYNELLDALLASADVQGRSSVCSAYLVDSSESVPAVLPDLSINDERDWSKDNALDEVLDEFKSEILASLEEGERRQGEDESGTELRYLIMLARTSARGLRECYLVQDLPLKTQLFKNVMSAYALISDMMVEKLLTLVRGVLERAEASALHEKIVGKVVALEGLTVQEIVEKLDLLYPSLVKHWAILNSQLSLSRDLGTRNLLSIVETELVGSEDVFQRFLLRSLSADYGGSGGKVQLLDDEELMKYQVVRNLIIIKMFLHLVDEATSDTEFSKIKEYLFMACTGREVKKLGYKVIAKSQFFAKLDSIRQRSIEASRL